MIRLSLPTRQGRRVSNATAVLYTRAFTLTDPLDRLSAKFGARYAPDTVRSTTLQSRRFLEVVGEKAAYTQADVLGYVDHLIRTGHSSRSIKTILAQVRFLFRANDWAWPVLDLHLPQQDDQGGPLLENTEVAALIAGAKSDGQPSLKVVALSTTYGFRSIELAAAMLERNSSPFIVAPTAKGGRRREHQVPPAIQSAIDCEPLQITRSGLHDIFGRLMRNHVRKPRPGEGWHSIRRSLITGLLQNGVPEAQVERFMGWKSRKTLMQYYRPFSEDLDAAIFAKHPFLKLWEANDE